MRLDDELRRQAALYAAIGDPGGASTLGLAGSSARERSTLAAWRANAAALADTALTPIYPTIRRMLGDADFAHLAGEFRAAHPPIRGDLAEWGEALPGFIAGHEGLRPWPWLADTARLDHARHVCERAFDAEVDVATFERLRTDAPNHLRLVLVPGTAIVESAWPLAAIADAHAAIDREADAAFADLRDAIASNTAESVMIVREGWRAAVHRLDAAEAAWLRCVLAGGTLAAALDDAGEAFDFAQWLARAVGRSWLASVERVDAADGREG